VTEAGLNSIYQEGQEMAGLKIKTGVGKGECQPEVPIQPIPFPYNQGKKQHAIVRETNRKECPEVDRRGRATNGALETSDQLAKGGGERKGVPSLRL